MRDDRLAALAELFVRSGLLGMPMRIEDGVNRATAGQAGDGFHQRVGGTGGSTIDEQDAVGAGLRHDIGFAWESHHRTGRRSAAARPSLRMPLAPTRPGLDLAHLERFRRRRQMATFRICLRV